MAKQKVKILLIEDDAFLSSMYTTKFELENFEVVSAEDGEKGVKCALEANPRIILLDIILPNMNGFEVLKKIKADPATKEIPVILLTNLSQKNDIDKGMSLGAIDFLIKAHFTPSEVVDKVKTILKI